MSFLCRHKRKFQRRHKLSSIVLLCSKIRACFFSRIAVCCAGISPSAALFLQCNGVINWIHLQACPLDLYTDCFYENRKEAIEARAELLSSASTETLQELLAEVWTSQEGSVCTLVNWERFSGLQQAQVTVARKTSSPNHICSSACL